MPEANQAWKNASRVAAIRDENLEEAKNEAKSNVLNLNAHFDDLYTESIISKAGYPLWNASIILPAGDQGYLYFAPILKESSTAVEGIFTLLRTDNPGENSSKAYSLTYLDEITNVTAPEETIANADILEKIFQIYNNVLFPQGGNSFDISLLSEVSFLFNDLDGCSLGLCGWLPCPAAIGVPFDPTCTVTVCYEYCACTQNLLALGIADTPEERNWINGNCKFSSEIESFLIEQETNSNFPIEDIAQVFLDLGMSDTYSYFLFRRLISGSSRYFNDPTNEEEIINMYNFFRLHNISPFDFSPFTKSDRPLPPLSTNSNVGWQDFNGSEFYDMNASGSYRQALRDQYVGNTTALNLINGLWACRVLGPALERASLSSIGLSPENNTDPPGFSKFPDGYATERFILNGVLINEQPTFVEVKGRFAVSTPLVYNYNGTQQQIDQFQAYRDYLSSSTNTFCPSNSASHGLYMILPDNVSLGQSTVIEPCSNQNIPLYRSGVQRRIDTPDIFRVKSPELLNIADIDYSKHMFSDWGDFIYKFVFENSLLATISGLNNPLETIVPYPLVVSNFEQSYLVGTSPPECDPEE